MTLSLAERRRALVALLASLQQRRRAREARTRLGARARRRRALAQLHSVAVSLGVLSARRVVERNEGGWEASTINKYVTCGDEQTYRKNFRVTKATLQYITDELSRAGHVVDNAKKFSNLSKRQTALFKNAVCLYYMAAGGETRQTGDAAGIGASTVEKYLEQFCTGVLSVLKPIYMSEQPPSAADLESIREEFQGRRGIAAVAMAVDGTHVPFRGGTDYRNYKGWESILVLAFVNSFHLFVGGHVGEVGRAGDNGVLAKCWLMDQIKANPDAWLGVGGMIAADGGASDGGNLLLNPIPNATEEDELFYNFCHSSTRFFVEEVFGRWKNRWRFLLRQMQVEPRTAVRLIYVSMILHNLCTMRADDAVDFKAGTDEEWAAFFKTYKRAACPSCVRRNAVHCPHIEKYKKAKPVGRASDPANVRREEIKDALFELCGEEALADMEKRKEERGRAD